MKYLRRYNEDVFGLVTAFGTGDDHHKKNAIIEQIFKLNLEGIDNLSIESIRVNTIEEDHRIGAKVIKGQTYDVDIEENFTSDLEISDLVNDDFRSTDNKACSIVEDLNRNILNKLARKYDFAIGFLTAELVDNWNTLNDDDRDQLYFRINFTITMNEPININKFNL